MKPINGDVVIDICEKYAGYMPRDIHHKMLTELEQLPSVQAEEAIPISWIEGEMAEMKSTGETSSYILAELIGAMVRKWREEQHE